MGIREASARVFRARFRLPLFVVVGALLVLIVVLGTLQYRWLGRISDAERERMKAMLNARASAFAQDVDRELTRAYLTFQDPVPPGDDGVAARLGARYERWQATARYPRIIKEVYVASVDGQLPRLQRFNPTTRFLEPAEWPASFERVRTQLMHSMPAAPGQDGRLRVQMFPMPVLDDVPALVVPTSVLMLMPHEGAADPGAHPRMSCTVLVLDRDYIVADLLPSLAQQHFRGTGDQVDYQLAVVQPSGHAVLYHSDARFSPAADDRVDATADLLQVRLQEFGELVSEVRRFSTFVAAAPPGDRRRTIVRETFAAPVAQGSVTLQPGAPVSIVVEQRGRPSPDKLAIAGSMAYAAASRLTPLASPRWRLMVKHPSGSLEQAVSVARRRNLLVSSSILAVLGVSVAFLIMSTRRAHDLARQQMEFVATVSHELRTPLAVIRSAADNLADGVVQDEARIRRYGELVRSEGRRLSELVEQILEYAGLQSGARPRSAQPVSLAALLREVAAEAQALAAPAGVVIELDLAEALPPVAGDIAALGRVFQNLIGNAVKYGADGRWVGVRAQTRGERVEVTITDRGIGIAPADQARIFDPFYRAPDVIAAQIQGAGLGLSLVKRIVAAHGGQVSVTSAPGAGSAFTVTLPIVVTDAAAADGVRAAATQHP